MNFQKYLISIVGCLLSIAMLSTIAYCAEDKDDELVQLVVELLSDKDKDVRALGFEQVRTEAKGSAATKKFAAVLATLSPEAQVGLLRALADRADATAHPAVVNLLVSSKEKIVKVAAIKAIGPLGSADDLKILLPRLSNGSADENAAARDSLIRLRGRKGGNEIPAALAIAMKSGSSKSKVVIIDILTVRRALATIPAIISAATASDANVRTAAMRSLGKIASAKHIAGMVQGVLKTESSAERAAAEKCVMFVCNRIADPKKRAEPLLAAVVKLKSADRLKMLSTLGRVGGAESLKIVEAAIKNTDGKIHSLGIRALCNWPNASVAARLTELANNDEHPSHQTSALRALIRVAPLKDKRTDTQRLQLLSKAMTMCKRDRERILVLDRARAVRTIHSLRFIETYMKKPPYSEQACLSIVELAHHLSLRVPHKVEFDKVLDKVILISKNPTVVDRAKRYQKGQTWVRPK